jgi:uncharacterized protein YndB with AHSA1/START domain
MDKKLKKTYEINAPVSKVWEAITTPEIIKQYFFGTDAISDFKEGSPLIYKGEWQGKTYEDKGTILKVIPEKLFTYTYWSSMSGKPDIPENYAVYSYELAEKNGNTELTLVQDDAFKSEESRSKAWEHWDIVMDGLKKVVEKT